MEGPAQDGPLEGSNSAPSTEGLDISEKLIQAAKEGVVKEVRSLLDAKADIDAKDEAGKTALHWAVFNSHEEVVSLLVDKGALLGAQDEYGAVELHWAAIRGHTTVARLLCEKITDIEVIQNDNWTALHFAARDGREGVAEILLDKGANVEAKTNELCTPLHWAAINGHRAVVDLLLRKGADIDAKQFDGGSSLELASYHGHNNVVALLLDRGADLFVMDNDGWMAMNWAAANGHSITMQLLLRRGALLNTKTDYLWTLLHTAADGGHIEVVRLLLRRMGQDAIAAKTDSGDTALHMAVRKKFKEVVELLLKKMNPDAIASKNGEGDTALHLAIFEDSEDMVGLLVDETDQDAIGGGDTALHLAVRADSRKVVTFLLEKMSQDTIATGNDSGETALSLAASKGAGEMVQLFVNHQADVTSSTRDSWRAVNRTTWKQVESIAKQLLKNIEGEEFSKNPKSPPMTLNWAARNGHKGIVEKIFETCPAGVADDEDRDTALYWASLGGHQEVLESLLGQVDLLAILAKGFGARALKAAARNGHEKIVEQLLRNVTKPKSADVHTWTPLHWAVNYGDKTLVRDMLMNGADPEGVAGGRSAVQMAKQMLGMGGGGGLEIRDITELLENPPAVLRTKLETQWSGKPETPPQELQDVCRQFHANITDFYSAEHGVFAWERSKDAVYDSVYGEGPDEIMSKFRKLDIPKLDDDHHLFRWIHLPANNWIWVEDLMKKVSDGNKSKEEYSWLKSFVEENCLEHPGRPHSRFIFPVFRCQRKDFRHAEVVGKRDLETYRTDVGGVKIGVKAGELKDGAQKNAYQGAGYTKGGSKNETQRKGGKETALDKKDANSRGMKQRSDGTSHLKGCKMAICMPFLTLETVEGQRRMRKAVRLAEEMRISTQTVRDLKGLQDAISYAKGESSVSDEAANRELRRLRVEVTEKRMKSARMILSKEIAEGLNLLRGTIKDAEKMSLTPKSVDKLKQLRNALEGAEPNLLDKAIKGNRPTDLTPTKVEVLDGLHRAIEDVNSADHTSKIFEWRERLQDAIDMVGRKKTSRDELLLQWYLRPGEEGALHVSRTLDQYYYPSLLDTKRRDNDQVIRRYQALGCTEEDEEKVKICMVDQLWLWIIDDKTIITCFPQRWDQKTANDRKSELLARIRAHVDDETHRPQMTSVYHMAARITTLCTDFVEKCLVDGPGGAEPLLHVFASTIGVVADREVERFEEFKREIVMQERDRKEPRSGSAGQKLRILEEIELLEEVKDISDELSILKSILEEQKYVLEELFKVIGGGGKSPERGEVANDPLLNYYHEWNGLDTRFESIEKMQSDAKTTYDSLNHLLDLKQKNANILEAAEARLEAEETTRQGRTIQMFTIVTIVFLPMSFLTSFYALNVTSFPHESGTLIYQPRWIFSRIFGTSAALAVPLVIVALYINQFLGLFELVARLRQRDDPKQKTPVRSPRRIAPGARTATDPDQTLHATLVASGGRTGGWLRSSTGSRSRSESLLEAGGVDFHTRNTPTHRNEKDVYTTMV